ncbi:MAG: asparagine synthase C-terminal domain-containing protein, partial [Anoxybacillus mongoliensis]|nr:asparagine synthase C-terminal domain-containing protein [Anoxybacillus mongoliensis]
EINILTKDLLLNFEPLHLGISGLKNMSQRQLLDIRKFSIPILTHYEDRMSMAWSREVRVPFLDYRLVEYLYSIPTDFKIKDGWTKYIFRKAIEKELPKEIVWRKDKQGFVNPQSEWLKHELKDTLLSYFHDKNSLIFKSNLIDQGKLILKYEQYCNQEEGKGGIWFKDIFSPLALEIWLRKYERFIEF